MGDWWCVFLPSKVVPVPGDVSADDMRGEFVSQGKGHGLDFVTVEDGIRLDQVCVCAH